MATPLRARVCALASARVRSHLFLNDKWGTSAQLMRSQNRLQAVYYVRTGYNKIVKVKYNRREAVIKKEG